MWRGKELDRPLQEIHVVEEKVLKGSPESQHESSRSGSSSHRSFETSLLSSEDIPEKLEEVMAYMTVLGELISNIHLPL